MAQLLAVAVGLGSLAVYFAAFFYPQIHRKPDFIWSGVGLFYAVALWFCAGRITGALLLGQGASVALMVGLAWQLGRLRLQVPTVGRSGAPSVAPTTAPPPAAPNADPNAAPTPRIGKWANPSGSRAKAPSPSSPPAVAKKRDRTPAYEFIDDTPTRPRRSQSAVLDSAETTPSTRVDAEKAPDEKARSQPQSSPSGPNTPPKATANSAPAQPPAPRLSQSPLTQVKIITGWLGDVAKSLRRPKPSYPTIVIPPRPPSIPTASSQESPDRAAR